MNTRKLAAAVSLPIWLAACVTINVYFPAAEAARAADRVLEEVYGKQPPAEAPAAPQGQSRAQGAVAVWLRGFMGLLVRDAHAQGQANIEVSSPTIQAITDSLKSRTNKLAPYFAGGAIGMANNGQVVVRDLNAVPLRERNALKQLLADENQDWNALYREVAKENGHPQWEADIRKTFVQRWPVKAAQSGWWYQDAGGNWKQKP